MGGRAHGLAALAVAAVALGAAAGGGIARAEVVREKPVSRPGPYLNVNLVLFNGIGYDEAFDASGWGARLGWISGRGRPMWYMASASLFESFDDNDPYTISGEVLIGRAIWLRDSYQIKQGAYIGFQRVVNSQGNTVGYDTVVRSMGTKGAFILWSDIVLAVGARTLVFAGTNVRDVQVDPVIAPQAGIWYHQLALGPGGLSRLRLGAFVAYDPVRGAFGSFGHLECTAWTHLHVGLHLGGIFGEDGGMEFSGQLGWEL